MLGATVKGFSDPVQATIAVAFLKRYVTYFFKYHLEWRAFWEQHLLKLREVLTRLQGAQLTIQTGQDHLQPSHGDIPGGHEGTDNIIADALSPHLEAHLDPFNSYNSTSSQWRRLMGGEDPVPPEKPAFKAAQALYHLLVTYDSTDSLIVLQGDSTRANTGWKGGTHAHLEKMLGRKLFWSICVLHTNELPLRHLITSIDGPTSSDTGFTGPVCSLLSSVNEMQYNAEFRGVPGGEDLTEIPEYILVNMSTDQQVSYQLVQAVKRGVLPSELQEIKCGKVSHSRWLTTAQSLVYMWTRKHGLTGKELNTLEIIHPDPDLYLYDKRLPFKYCLQVYFKLYYDIKVHHRLEDGPKHILTQLRVMRSQPKKVQTAVTFSVRTGASFAHSECVLLSLMASQSEDDRRFAVTRF
ncbi:hypothetical protein GWK47_006576 [Chionoecetes opilio]|uniref:Uncharacterized protein n=1 Tax=Chionoecetes opilio TaxID=41210 RepID=A0A8J4Y5C3_CHIOP|nr:hypothetical protein GWK47_006576 [Chionoecetes opilio]